MIKTVFPQLWLVITTLSFNCEDDIYRDCGRRARSGQCEVDIPNIICNA